MFAQKKATSPENAQMEDPKELREVTETRETIEVLYNSIQEIEVKWLNVTTVKELATSPEIVLKREKKDKKDQADQRDKTDQTDRIDQKDNKTKDSVVPNATTVNNQDTWPNSAPDNQPKKNATAVKRLVTLPETAPKVTERLLLNVTNVTKLDILPNNAKVTFTIIT